MPNSAKSKSVDWEMNLANHRKYMTKEPLEVARLNWNTKRALENLVVFSYDMGDPSVYNDSRPFAMAKNADLSYDMSHVRRANVLAFHPTARTDDGDLARVLRVDLQDLNLLSVHAGTNRFTALVREFNAYDPSKPCDLDNANDAELTNTRFENMGYSLQPPKVIFDAPVVPMIVSVYYSNLPAWIDWFEKEYPIS